VRVTSSAVFLTPRRIVAGSLILLGLGVVVGLVALWPGAGRANVGPITPGLVQGARVTHVSGEGCEKLQGRGCQLADVVLTSGPGKGTRSTVALPSPEFAPVLKDGDRIRVTRNASAGDAQTQPLSFVDFERGRALYVLLSMFAVVVVALAGWQGLRSLIGLGVSLLVVVAWIVPAILSGRPPLATALIGGVAVMLATTAITHGFGLKSAAAMLGATATLVLIVAMGVFAVHLAHITGFSSDEANILDARAKGEISIQGLVLAGIVVGALGVLDDITVSQASTVLALRRADPTMAARRLFREGLTVGRDHLGATVNTLVLAYVGASLPTLLVLAGQGTPFGDAVGFEDVAEEIVATLVGSTGLVAAVPLTTGLAALLATRVPAGSLPAEHHAH
jgi:uncharacterized membrane protein